ncbi:hypothetical protein DRW41_03700 [Neobacillus piezotolerans]|uniref:Knr4/Smi1-like domain-containing protein n=1 Tax=Neobacillus piezotolerans TaxID=2259171 RepID=A0A3D8GW64_9BACI|nr:SMI1/KNR4 family protein [Neobacillus piezotolerans]RDU38675.1 hypothetical protein DRW41_03700 [Neobacillus piezotolerans]
MSKLTWKYVKPLKDNESVEGFEALNDVQLPKDITDCIKQNNGGRPDKKVFDTDVSEGRVMKSLLSFNKDDLETVYDAIDVLKNERKSLVPIASDPSGNYICYNLIHKDIVFWLHETNITEKVSDSFTTFLNGLYVE